MKVPVVMGNCVTYGVALELMEAGISGLLVGVGPGAACTTRGVLGLGVPQVTATVDCAAARDFFHKKSGQYVPIITDGGMSTGGDICKAIACGSDGVMIGSAFARAKEAPGMGYHWVKRTNIVFNTEAGFNYQAQYLQDNLKKEILYLRLAEDAAWKISRRTSIDEKFEYFPSTEDFSNYRIRFESNLRYAILNNLSFIVTVLDTYETQTARDVPQNDLQIRSSVGVKF